MSDYTSNFIPWAPGTPEYNEYTRGTLRGLGIPATEGLRTIIAQASPIGKTEAGNYELTPPGLLTSVYGGIGAGIPTISNAMLGTSIPNAPGSERALEMYASNKRALEGVIPRITPENSTERLLEQAAGGAAGMISPIPMSGLARLPNVARQAAQVLIPTKEAMPVAVPLGAAATPALTALAEHGQPSGEPLFSFGMPSAQAATLSQPQAQPTTPSTPQSTPPVGDPEPLFQFGTPTPSVESSGTPMFQFGTANTGQGVDFSRSIGPSGSSLGERMLYWGAGGAAAWLTLKYGGRTWTNASRMMRTGEATRDAADVALNTKFNADLAAQDPLRMSVTDRPLEAPLPGTAAEPGTRFRQYWSDPNAVVKEYYNSIASSPNAAKEFEATLGRVNSNQSMSRIINAFLRTGVDTFTNETMPSVKQWGDKIMKLTEQQRDTLNTAMFAKDELNTRVILTNRNAQSATRIGPIPDDRVNFFQTSSDDLRNYVRSAEADPLVKDIMDEAWIIGRRNLDIALKRGYITQADFNTLIRTRPNYVPSTGVDGRVLHILDERTMEPGSGWKAPPTTAWSALVQHQDRLFRAMATNDYRNALKRAAMTHQANNPNAARIFETKTYQASPTQAQLRQNLNAPPRTLISEGNPAERAFITRTPNGPEVTYVHNSQLYHGIIGPPAWYNIANGIAQNTRRWLQSGQTGEVALFLAQKPFPLINLVRNTLALNSYAPAGTYGGLIDKGLKSLGRTGDYRGVDPTNWLGVPASVVQDTIAIGAKHAQVPVVPVANALGRGLANTSNPLSQTLRAIKGDQWVDALAQRLSAVDGSMLENYYQTSQLGRQHALGMGGEGAQGGIELPTLTLSGVEASARNAMGSQVPGLMGEPKIPFTNVIIPTSISHTAINLRSFIRDVFDVVSNGANSYHYKINESNPALSSNRQAYESSRIFGTPGEVGTGRVARTLGAGVPFFTAGMQGATRAAEQFVNHPFGFAMGAASSMGMMALAEIYSALFSGPDHIDHLSQKVDSQSLAANGIIYLGANTDPNHHVRISLIQDWRPLYPYILEGLATGLDAFNARSDEDLRTRLLDTLGDIFSHHTSNSIDDASLHGVADFLAFMPPFQSTPVLTAAMSSAGAVFNTNVPTRVDPYKWLKNVQEGDPLKFSNTGAGGVTQKELPGQAEYDSGLASVDGGVTQALINSFLGAVSGAYAELRTLSREDADEFWPDLRDTLLIQRPADSTPAGALIWGTTLQQSRRTPLIENNFRALERMKSAASANAELQNYGLTRQGGLPIQPTAPRKPPTDPIMLDIYQRTGAVYNDIQRRLMPMANDIQTRIKSIQEGKLSFQTKRTLTNGLADQLLEKHKLIAQRISALESALSMKYGRHISVMKTDFQRGFDQYD